MDFSKQALPGYTGYIPQKFQTFGVTMGQVSKTLVEKTITIPNSQANNIYNSPAIRPLQTAAKELFGFKSNYQKTWVCGPMDQLYNQQIPGYGGHIPGAATNNNYGKTYGVVTRKSMLKRFGEAELTAFQRFRTTNSISYKNPQAKHSIFNNKGI